LIHSVIHSVIHSLLHACIHSLIHSLINSRMHSLMQSWIHSLIHPGMHSFIDPRRWVRRSGALGSRGSPGELFCITSALFWPPRGAPGSSFGTPWDHLLGHPVWKRVGGGTFGAPGRCLTPPGPPPARILMVKRGRRSHFCFCIFGQKDESQRRPRFTIKKVA
jgi:hypothetical protein